MTRISSPSRWMTLDFIAEEGLADLAGEIALGEVELKREWLEGDGEFFAPLLFVGMCPLDVIVSLKEGFDLLGEFGFVRAGDSAKVDFKGFEFLRRRSAAHRGSHERGSFSCRAFFQPVASRACRGRHC